MEEMKLKGNDGGRGVSERVVVKVEDTRPGAFASTLKASDQMSGQTFNDVGRVNDEGVYDRSDKTNL